MDRYGRLAALSAIVGGLAWIPIRIAISVTFSRPLLDLTYVEWNRLMLIPLPLLAVAAIRLARDAARRAARIGAWLAVLGLLGMIAGVFVEFYIAGGLAGDRAGALLGWGIYLVSLLAHVIGLATYGLASLGERRLPALTALSIAVLHVLWLPAGIADVLVLLDQALIGAAWVLLGVVLWRRR